MPTIIENAAKGQRKALEGVYESNKQRIYYIAKNLLLEETQAVSAVNWVFKSMWSTLAGSGIVSEESFANAAVLKTAEYCKKQVEKQNPKAFRVPMNKNFQIATDFCPFEGEDGFDKYLLGEFSELQRFIYVLHTAGGLNKLQLSKLFKFDQNVISIALEAEKVNIERMIRAAAKTDSLSYEQVTGAFSEQCCKCRVPAEADKKVAVLIDSIAKPVEEKMQKKLVRSCIIAAAVLVCIIGGILIKGLVDRNVSADTGNDSLESTSSVQTVINSPVIDLDENASYFADIIIEDYGTITVEMDQNSAPVSVSNFINLAQEGFYDGLTFHRIIEGFMMQGGDPNGNGSGGSAKKIVGEFAENGYENELSHTRGAISMARSKANDSASSQFFIVHEDSTSLDGKYAAFGYVTEGIEVVDAVCESAKPTDNNGTIPADAQPVIKTITIRVE